jgi:hypothetical protein
MNRYEQRQVQKALEDLNQDEYEWKGRTKKVNLI